MKKIYLLMFTLQATYLFAQVGAPATYYSGFNWSLTGMAMKNALATKITTTHTNILSYAEAESALKIVDLDPADTTNTNLFLLYGFSQNICPSSITDDNDHRRRNKNADGGGASCEWNREHVYAKSLGTPNLGETGAGADAHHLRACDVQRNSDRSSSKFGAGSGNSGYNGSLWYPGDEWKGDVARNMMYLYLRYPTQCKPTGVGSGATVASDASMVNLFLLWNAEDPVSQYESNRNTYLGNSSNTYGQGNRNPFIDNPYLATVIWGGQVAQNLWPNTFLSSNQFDILGMVSIFPNPTNGNKVTIQSDINLDIIELININGQVIERIEKPVFENNSFELNNLQTGFYFVKLSADNQSTTKKLIVN